MTSSARPAGDDPDDLLADLDPEQRTVATALEGPVVVVAGAGTGKTRALTHRIAYGVRTGAFEASGVLAVTFTTRAAGEMRARLARLGVPGVPTRTFHSAALAQVRYLWPRLYDHAFPDVLDNPHGLVGDLANHAGLGASVRDLVTEIGWAKVSNVSPQQYRDVAVEQARHVSGASPTQVARLYGDYVAAMTKADRADLEDVLLAAVGMLATQEAAARVVRQRYRWFQVDEFQDVSALQMSLLDCWLGERDDVCVVGDPCQAIYGFAGARADYLQRFAERFPDAHRLELTHNYRSTPQVLAVASAVLGPSTDGVPLRPTRPAGSRVALVEAEHAEAEAEQVASSVRSLVSTGVPERDIAVLTRTRAQIGLFVRALQAHGVTAAVQGATSFYERPEVRQLVALLSAANRRAERVAADSSPDRDASGQPVPSLAASVRDVLVDAGWSEQRPTVSRETSRWDSWVAVVEMAAQLERDAEATRQRPPSVADLLALMREQARTGAQPGGAGVTVATLHATKGQQWSAVFVVGAHDGGIPARSALTQRASPEALDEERRLLYVGLTRAADHLSVSWARRGQSGGPQRGPSRFVAGLSAPSGHSADIQLHPLDGTA